EDYYALLEPVPVTGDWFRGTSRLWAERLCLQDKDNTHVVARYGACNGWLDDQIAITLHAVGRGMVTYVGVVLDPDAQQALLDRVMNTAGVRPVWHSPAGVEVRARLDAHGQRNYILVNHGREEKLVRLPWPAHDHLNGKPVANELKLAAYGVAILTQVPGSPP
ncbi:MAG: Beta-galactosidase C-terminal domain, partial [Anaerolineales bacterium]